MSFPYSFYRCSCNSGGPVAAAQAAKEPVPGQNPAQPEDEEEDDDDETFDPSSPRSSYSLYPLDTLMWCEDCHDIRCPRCTVEEIVVWYCPNCLFEVPSSTVKTDGNRCTRNCFNCPECTAQLQTVSLDPEGGSTHGPFVLNCTFCNWNSLDIGLKFDSPRHILEQLRKSMPSRARRVVSRTNSSRLETVPEPGPDSDGNNTSRDVSPITADARKPQDAETRFANLKAFYKEQMSKASPLDSLRSPGTDVDYSSPGNLQRIMSLYSSSASARKTNEKEKPRPMREVKEASEGLSLFSAEADAALVSRLRNTGLQSTTSVAQRAFQKGISDNPDPRWLTDLRPVPTLLCTKRSGRCSVCKHILVKPEPKVSHTRYRIKLIAADKVPAMSLQAMNNSPSDGEAQLDLQRLPAHKTQQFLLKLTNPMFDSVKVSLATAAEVPSAFGRGASRVTILCPEFEIGANSDMWDEALGAGRNRDRGAEGDGKTAVAGRVWEKGRNWTTVVVEVVPERPKVEEGRELGEDQDVLEIPIFVRLIYDADVQGEGAAGGGGGGGGGGKERKERRTLSYWTVLGVGRIALE